jgi:hypothetical protein
MFDLAAGYGASGGVLQCLLLLPADGSGDEQQTTSGVFIVKDPSAHLIVTHLWLLQPRQQAG